MRRFRRPARRPVARAARRLLGLGAALALLPAPADAAAQLSEATPPPAADASADAPEGAFRQAPEVLPDAAARGVGRLVPDLRLTLADGATTRLSALADGGPLVVVARDPGCPLGKRFGPSLAALEAEYADRGVTFLHLAAGPADEDDALLELHAAQGIAGPVVRDDTLHAALAPTTTTEAYVIDAARTLRYRGAVDDQYGIGYALDAPRTRWLARALDEVLAGDEVTTPATTAPGCALDAPESSLDATITWHGDVGRIVQARCQGCHRAGGVAPFAFEERDDVADRAAMVRFVIDNGVMPPWHAEGGGPWTNDRRLTDDQRDDLLAWLDAGAPEGDPADAPLPVRRPDTWRIGEPDLIVENPVATEVPADGVVDYTYGWVQTPLDEDRWVTAIEVRPGAPQVVHHVLVFLDEPRREGESRRDFERRSPSGLYGYFAAYVPGQAPLEYPEGRAKKLPAGAWLKFQMHYQPNGEAVTDVTRIGFRFADGPPDIEVRTSAVSTTKLAIPAGEPDHRVRAGIRFDEPAVLAAFSPHMHYRGKAYRYELHYPDESRQVLLDVPRYDFGWQTLYQLADPVEVPAGTVLVGTGWFDNSADNPANPDPSREVYFGEQTWEEMMIGYFEWWPAGG